MSKKKNPTSSKKHYLIPLKDRVNHDILHCTANCQRQCFRRVYPRKTPYSIADLTELCLDYKEKTNAHTTLVPTRRP